ncbi:MAG: TonB-dependent receptor [SAR86 cluster bacterium]|uniref:TonB-dependent receptor n=1 Tax=SAR86 cluster bacterium TaxID=2030880 RepID=A0A2A4MRY9_9GAMM|nr:MAG: TonB-dependent receptor [SAR86 cluster bacterium]
MLRKLLVIGIAAATALSAQQGMAQNGQQAIEEITIISASRRAESLGDINASIAVIGTEELQLVSATHAQEALNRLPGVNISRNNGQESLTSIRSPILTGSGACGAFLVAEQGIPVRAAGFCNVNEMFDAHTENAQRIEVIRGPGSAFYGSNAVHGMINVVLPEPGERSEFSLETGPRGYGRFNAAIGSEKGAFKQVLLFNGVSEEGWRDDSGVDQQKLSWLYQYTTDGGLALDGGFTTTNLNQETAGYVVGTDAYKDNDLRATNPNPEAFRDSQSSRVWTSISTTINDWDLVLTPYFRETNMTFMMHFLPGTPVEDSEQRSLGLQFASYRQLTDHSTLALGLDLESTDGKLKQFQENPTAGSAFLVNTIPNGLQYDYEVAAKQSAVFANYQHYWNSGWDMTLGLRYERVSYDYDNQANDGRVKEDGTTCGFGGCRYNRPSDRKDSFTNLSPKLALRYQINDQHNVQFRLQQGYRAPQATEMYRLQNSQSVADLESVELDSVELALTGAGASWNYTITAYSMNKDNGIITDSSRTNIDGIKSKHRGLEFALGYDLTETLSFAGTFNLAEHSYETSRLSGGIDIKGNDIDSAPNSFGNLRLQWRPSSKILTELELVNMDDYYTNPENTRSYEGHNLLNLRTRYAVNEDLSVALNILNLTDEKYAERADWSTFTGDRYFTGEPVRAFISIDWKY